MLHSKPQQSRVSLVHRARLCAGGTGQPMVDRLLTDLADELEQVTERQYPAATLTGVVVGPAPQMGGREMRTTERAVWARYDAAVRLGSGTASALRYATQEVRR